MTEYLQAVLDQLELGELFCLFEAQGIDDSVLADLTDSDLREMGIDKMGYRKKLIAAFKPEVSDDACNPVSALTDVKSVEAGGRPTFATRLTEMTREPPWINSLGMPFAPIPRFDTRFCIWPVRVQDYEAYCMASGTRYPSISFQQEPDHPIVNVSWNDAIEFCVWLTEKERSEADIDQNMVYRLPTDLEWSAAVGFCHEPQQTPEDRSKKLPGYPWGLRWPPSKGVGNYDPELEVDSFDKTSPVGSFPANAAGIYDMGGNVWEWCMDLFDFDNDFRVLRGASWYDGNPEYLLSSFRSRRNPECCDGDGGFRCVLVGGSSREAGGY